MTVWTGKATQWDSLTVRNVFLSCRVFDNDTTIRLVSDNKCVDISDYSTDDGANIW